MCKHVIALVMAYNEHPDDFAAADDGNGSTNGIGRGAAGLVPWQPAVRTTRALDLFIGSRTTSAPADRRAGSSTC